MIYPSLIDLIIMTTPGLNNTGERNTEEMETKYGTITQEQLEEYKTQLHAMVHWLLVYKEKNYEGLDEYFSSILFRINGLNSVLNYPRNMLGLMATLESARLENLSEEFNFKKYRKAVLDAHSIIDKIGEPEEEKEINNDKVIETTEN